MKSPLVPAVRPALASLLLLGVAACGPASGDGRAASVAVAVPSAVPVAATGAANPAAPASGGSPTAHASAAAARPAGKASAPAPGGSSVAAAPASSAPAAPAVPPPTGAAPLPLPVAAAQPGAQTVAIGTPSTDGSAAVPAAATDLRLTAYDPAAGTAVLSAPAASSAPAAAPAASSPAAVPALTQAVRPGRLLASPPTDAAPQGALLAVTAVHPGAGNTLGLATRPATLPELLGAAEVDGTVPVDPKAIKVTPLVKDVTATVGRENGTTEAAASGTLEVDAKAPIPLPGATAEATGELALHPTVRFAYHGAGVGTPRTASIGFDLGARAHWKVTGDFARATAAPVRVPFAKLQASPVLTVAGLPVVVNLALTCYLEVGADGQVHVEAEQEATGTWAVRADWTGGGRGWTSSADAPDTKVSPVHVRLDGKASVRATLGTEVSVGLYDAVGVEATVAPYLQAKADGSLAVDVPGGAPRVQGSWGLVGGIDLNGALLAHLKIFGTPLIEGRLPLPVFHREWPLLAGTLPTPTPKG
ncbi:hypothetical protein OG401_31210 [Kitasatospora purpeofusca]|uniref:hypothetical protein n=1 Tax=Kitasatospora purpeofusca TaxID=67352 RepID=UPI00225ACBE9|nr:hypothetical protein [Kitasatospora purpeofusca]MCX4688712.1 hypothetical protein [Kitasatospora purpeofusca]